MSAVPLREARQAVVRDRVLEGVAALLAAGDELTFAKVCLSSMESPSGPCTGTSRPGRSRSWRRSSTWANQRIGFEGAGRDTTDAIQATALIRQRIPGVRRNRAGHSRAARPTRRPRGAARRPKSRATGVGPRNWFATRGSGYRPLVALRRPRRHGSATFGRGGDMADAAGLLGHGRRRSRPETAALALELPLLVLEEREEHKSPTAATPTFS